MLAPFDGMSPTTPRITVPLAVLRFALTAVSVICTDFTSAQFPELFLTFDFQIHKSSSGS